VSYAACDALAAVLIFVAMVQTKTATYEADDYSCIAAKAKSLCQGVIDLKYSGRMSDNHASSDRVSSSWFWEKITTFHCKLLRLLLLLLLCCCKWLVKSE